MISSLEPTSRDGGFEQERLLPTHVVAGKARVLSRIMGKLTIVSSATSGTEVTLVVPGGIVFQKKNNKAGRTSTTK